MTSVCVAAEGACDVAAASKIAQGAGLTVQTVYDCRGKAALDRRLNGFFAAANLSGWIIFRDLDNDAECAPLFLQNCNVVVPKFACLRMPVRSLESWLFADVAGLSRWMRVSPSQLPNAPEDVAWPKRDLANLALKSTNRVIRERMAPRPSDGSLVGPEYGAAVYEFIRDVWDFRAAAESGKAPSLVRAIACIEQLREKLEN